MAKNQWIWYWPQNNARLTFQPSQVLEKWITSNPCSALFEQFAQFGHGQIWPKILDQWLLALDADLDDWLFELPIQLANQFWPVWVIFGIGFPIHQFFGIRGNDDHRYNFLNAASSGWSHFHWAILRYIFHWSMLPNRFWAAAIDSPGITSG